MSEESDDWAEHDEEEDADAALDPLLRALARPPSVGRAALAHIAVPTTLELKAGSIAAMVAPEPSEPQPGESLDGRFEIERELGRGGMGVVYAARNLRTGKRVALKLLTARRAGSLQQRAAMVERFHREARAVAAIRHPNVVDLYDIGGSKDLPFLVMELLEGESLRERLLRSVLSWDEACDVLLPVLRGVSAAHRAGTVHRDLKPDNIFLAREDGASAPVPKVLDFGVAAIRSDSQEGAATLTRSGMIVGTPSYMPLEQLTGGDVDERSDVFALGVVLYEALSGKLPFEARSAGELAVMQATGAPTLLSVHRPDLRGARESLVMKALAKDKVDRYQSVDAFAGMLVSGVAHGAPSLRRSRRLVAWFVVLALLGAASAYAVLGRRATLDNASSPSAQAPAAPLPAQSDRSPAQPSATDASSELSSQPSARPSGASSIESAPAAAADVATAAVGDRAPRRPAARPDEPRAKRPAELKPQSAPTDLTFEEF